MPVLSRLMVVMERLEMQKLVMERSEMEMSEMGKAEIAVLKVLQGFRVKLGTKGTAQPR